jgi:hypothetical protein
VNNKFAVWSRGDRHIGRESQGGRHDEAVVVVGVFANEVYTAWCAEYPGPLIESLLELLAEFTPIHVVEFVFTKANRPVASTPTT